MGGNKLGHGRVPSTGKNLHKLSRATAQRNDDARAQRKVQSPPTSPTAALIKRNSSNYSLSQAGSKVNNIRKNKSDVAVRRHTSGSKAAKGPKSERGAVQFDVGEDEPDMEGTFEKAGDGQEDHEEEWTEASNSQSPAITRRSSVAPLRSSNLEEPPSPDDPPARSPPVKLPDSPPKSPVHEGNEFSKSNGEMSLQHPGGITTQNDAQAIHRIMNLHAQQPATAQLSSISALIAPSSYNKSPNQAKESSGTRTPSMPSDGISRFLPSTGHPTDNSSSSNSDPNRHLGSHNSSESNSNANTMKDGEAAAAPSQDPSANLIDARKAQSAVNLTHHQLTPSTSSQTSTSPDGSHHQGNHTSKDKHTGRASPFNVHHASKGAGISRSLTQLKLDLERMKATQEIENEKASAQRLPSPTLVLNGGSIHDPQNQYYQGKSKIGTNGSPEERIRAMYESVEREYVNMRRFQDVTVKAVRRLEKRGKVNVVGLSGAKDGSMKKKRQKQSTPQQGGSSGSLERGDSTHRGRVRFDLARAQKDVDERGSEEEDGTSDDGVQGILRRMWSEFEAAQEVGVSNGE